MSHYFANLDELHMNLALVNTTNYEICNSTLYSI